MVRVELDESKCKSVHDCRRCLEVCPQDVFMTYARSARRPGKRAGDWVIMPVLVRMCTGCMVCEQVCPTGAIKITVGLETAVAVTTGRSLISNVLRGVAGVLLIAGQKLYDISATGGGSTYERLHDLRDAFDRHMRSTWQYLWSE